MKDPGRSGGREIPTADGLPAVAGDVGYLEVYLRHVGESVEPALRSALLDDVDPGHREAVAYAIDTGGKRLRPALALLACQAAGGPAAAAVPAAAAIEALHHLTLIVDDVIDGSAFRRGRPTVWRRLGRSVAQCVAWHYAAGVFAAGARAPHPAETMAVLARALKAVADGEILDVLQEASGRADEPFVLAHRPPSVDEGDWRRMAGGKSAALFAAACEVGAVAAGAPSAAREALRRFGHHLGLAFQAQDDLLDVFGDEARFGKRVGKDLLDRKRGNLVILHALEAEARCGERTVADLVARPPEGGAALEAAVARLAATGARDRAEAFARGEVAAAHAALDPLPSSPWTTTLRDVADYVVVRAR